MKKTITITQQTELGVEKFSVTCRTMDQNTRKIHAISVNAEKLAHQLVGVSSGDLDFIKKLWSVSDMYTDEYRARIEDELGGGHTA